MVIAATALAALLWTGSVAQAAPILDLAGDTFNTGTIDILSTEVLFSGGIFTTTISFAAPVAAPSAFAPNSLVGFMDLDTDKNAATGGTAPWFGAVTGGNNWINFFIPPNPGTPTIPGPTTALGDEFYVDLGSELLHSGLVELRNTSANALVANIAISYLGTSVRYSFSSALLGGATSLNYGLLVGDFAAPTDRAPNGVNPVSSQAVPEPGSIALFGLGLGLIARRLRS
jgi:hypothetical protein